MNEEIEKFKKENEQLKIISKGKKQVIQGGESSFHLDDEIENAIDNVLETVAK